MSIEKPYQTTTEEEKESPSIDSSKEVGMDIWKDEIAASLDFRELFDILNRLGEITGSDGHVYDTNYLKITINEVRRGVKSLNFITNSLGLRDKVRELLSKK